MIFFRGKDRTEGRLLRILRVSPGTSGADAPLSYEPFFGLTQPAFSLTPDTAFFFERGSHQEALNVLLVALASGEGFLKVVGEVGTGKTLICRKLLVLLDSAYVTAYIHYPLLTPDGLRMALADELGLETAPGMDQHRLLKALQLRLLEITEQGRRVVVCLDEAQSMPDETLEALRLLSNLETEKEKLLSVILFGQPELDERLSGKNLRQLRSRIAFSHQIEPMSSELVQRYIAHRLEVAGDSQAAARFTSQAVQMIAQGSRGIPRIVNILAHKALLAAWGQGRDQILADHARRAVQDTEDALQSSSLPLDMFRALAPMAFQGG